MADAASTIVDYAGFREGVEAERAAAAEFREAAALVVAARDAYPADSVAVSVAVEGLRRAIVRERDRMRR